MASSILDHRLMDLRIEEPGHADRLRAVERITMSARARQQKNAVEHYRQRRREQAAGMQQALAGRLVRSGAGTSASTAQRHNQTTANTSNPLSASTSVFASPSTPTGPLNTTSQPVKSRRKKKTTAVATTTQSQGFQTNHRYVAAFFSKFPSIPYQRQQPIMPQFHRVRELYQWSSAKTWEEDDLLCTAIAQDFGLMFGTNKDNLEAWQAICRVIGIVTIPFEIDDCKSNIKYRFFDPWTLVESVLTGSPAMIFDTKGDLDRHVTATGNTIPANPLRTGGAFLRELASVLADAAAHAPVPEQHGETPQFIADYFAQFPAFRYNAHGATWEQFYALSRQSSWDRVRFQSEQDAFRDALVQEFNGFYGTDEHDLRVWQALCYEVRVEPLPTTIKRCRQAIAAKHVNLVDLVDCRRTGQQVQSFPSEVALSKYTLQRDPDTYQRNKIFPKENAYAGGLLRHLLRNIYDPTPDPPRARNTQAS